MPLDAMMELENAVVAVESVNELIMGQHRSSQVDISRFSILMLKVTNDLRAAFDRMVKEGVTS